MAAVLEAPGWEAVAEVLRRLPVLPGREAQIESWARRIAFVAAMGRINLSPRARRVGTNTTLKELQRVADAAFELHDLFLFELHRDTLDALKRSASPHPFRLATELERVLDACNAAVADLQASDRKKAPSQPKKPHADFAAREAGKGYEALTGCAIGRSRNGRKIGGPAVRYMEEIFRALDIEASPAEAVLKLVMQKKASKSRS